MSAPTTTRKQRQKANKARGQAERARSILDELAAQHAARAAQSSADDGPEDAPATSTPTQMEGHSRDDRHRRRHREP